MANIRRGQRLELGHHLGFVFGEQRDMGRLHVRHHRVDLTRRQATVTPRRQGDRPHPDPAGDPHHMTGPARGHAGAIPQPRRQRSGTVQLPQLGRIERHRRVSKHGVEPVADRVELGQGVTVGRHPQVLDDVRQCLEHASIVHTFDADDNH
jgi:hypothetical protein